jgi:hypothetical protein
MRKGELEGRVGPGKMQGGGVAKKIKFGGCRFCDFCVSS